MPATIYSANELCSYDEAVKRHAAGATDNPAANPVRLGVIVPSVNTVIEPWYSAVVSAGVSIHFTRMLLAAQVTPETLHKMESEDGMAAAERIAGCKPHVVAYCCTASSVVQGLEYDAALQRKLQHVTGCKTFTAVRAIVDALHTLKAHRISIASPYSDTIDEAERQFFEKAGFEVVGTANLRITDGFALASPSPREIYELSRKAWRKEADALVISCLNMNSQTVVELLESAIKRPVVTSTTATLWKMLRLAGVEGKIPDGGCLFGN